MLTSTKNWTCALVCHSASEFFDNTNACLTGVCAFHDNQAREFEGSLTGDSDAQISFGYSYTYYTSVPLNMCEK